MHELLTKRWIALAARFSPKGATKLLEEIVKAYSRPRRFYHNTDHITALLEMSEQFAHKLFNRTVVDFAIFYHDIVYRVPGSDNEHKSAVLAASRLKQLEVPQDIIQEVCRFIEATKTHDLTQANQSLDLPYFLDFDMSILGSEWSYYLSYVNSIRKEYSFYPDMLYVPGRRKFLESTLSKPSIFLTPDFRDRFEKRARENMERELGISK